MLPADARAALEASTRWMIGERDSLHACISDVEGNIPDDDDGDYLRNLDRLIDANQAVLAKYPEGEDPCKALVEVAKRIKPTQSEIDREQHAAWWSFQAALARAGELYDGGTEA